MVVDDDFCVDVEALSDVELDEDGDDDDGGSFSVEGCSVVGLGVVGFAPSMAMIGFTVRCAES